MIDRIQAKCLWDGAADWWARHLREDLNRTTQVIPKVLELMGNVDHKEILDAGCGEGTIARALSDAGALVTGIDACRLIEFAKVEEAKNPKGIRYQNGDIYEVARIVERQFDSVLCSLVLHSCPDLLGALRSLKMVLGDRGSVLVVDLNPRFVTPYTDWMREWKPIDHPPNGSFLIKIVDDAPPVPYFHRTSEEWQSAIVGAGFRMAKSFEPDAPAWLGRRPGESLFMFLSLEPS